MGSEYFLRQQFACRCVARRQVESDQIALPAGAPDQAGATIKKNLEVLGYGE